MVDLVRQAIESRYEGVCTITIKETKRVNGVTKTVDTVFCQNQPCRLSFETGVVASDTDTKANAYQQIKLFIAPEIEIKDGAKITITQNNRTNEYKRSGKPLVYSNHQEILLDIIETS